MKLLLDTHAVLWWLDDPLALATETLPMHHRDPFDRMLVPQALIEGATLVSRDPFVAAYGLPTITA